MEGDEKIRIENQTNSFCGALNSTNGSDSYKERKITIEVENIENILSISSQLLIYYKRDATKVKEISVRIEFKGQVIAETEGITIPETGECPINISGSIPMEEPTPQFMDDILANPVVFTVVDRTFPEKPEKNTVNDSKRDSKRDSKKGISRTSLSVKSRPFSSCNILGICNMDLGSIIKGRTLIRDLMILELEKSGSGHNLVAWPKLPRLSAFASTGEEPLIPPDLNVLNNIINVTVESVYNVPRNIEEGTTFEAQTFIPNFSDKLNALVFPDGMLICSSDYECVKRWVALNHIEGRGALTKYKVKPDVSDIINPDNEIPDLEKFFKSPGRRIHWNKWRSAIMVKSASNYFFRKLANFRVWPIEVGVAPRPSSQKMAKGEKRVKTVPVTSSLVPERYVAYLRLGSLLYPGVTRVRVASRLYSYSPLDVHEKCGGDFVTHNVTNNTINKAKTGDRAKSSGRDVEENKDSPGAALYNEDGRPVFIVVEVEVWKPYIPKREPEFFFDRFSSYFTPKPKVSKKEMNLNLAGRNFSNVIEQMACYINDSYEKFIMQAKNSDLYYSTEGGFIHHLCQEGTFQKIKGTLEDKIVHLVCEKYGEIGNQSEKVTEVFVDLVNQMHSITNKFTTWKAESLKTTHNEANDLQLSAEEAIEDENYDVAKRYLVQKLWSNKQNPDYWLDYALYLIVLEDYDKSVETIREALSLDMEHQMALLMYGLIMIKLNNIYLAELTFQVLLAKYPDFIEGWVILHLFYSTIGNLDGAEYSIQMASTLESELKKNRASSEKKLTEGRSSMAYGESGEEILADLAEGRYGISSFSRGRSLTDPLSWTLSLGTEYGFYLKTVVLLLRLHFFDLAQSLLIRESHPERPEQSLEYLYYTAVNHYLRGQFTEALYHLKTAAKDYGKNCFLLSLMGHCYYKLSNYDNCTECFEYVIESYDRPNDIHLIHIRMGRYYMKTNKYKCAKKLFLSACKYSPSAETWLGLGAACYNLGNFEEAETALMEANYLDHMHPVVWAYLTLVNIQLKRYDAVELCYAEAKKKNLMDNTLITEIETLMEAHRLKN